ncbi:Protease HtpX-like protein [Chlamydiales bacterium STE3]|nr:Protease HtpX-like protein [Chlamydiales bacterium STE3]
MAMDFWKAQQKAKSRTAFYLTAFFVMTFSIAFSVEWILQNFFTDDYSSSFPWFALAFCTITFTYAFYNYRMYQQQGGGYVAKSLGARLIQRSNKNVKETTFYNICEEMSVAAALPLPEIYVLDATEINAFAAGLTPHKAAVTVTSGALNLLTRDELQGVIAHEFGHIYNGDMKINLKLAAMVAGFFVVLYCGIRLMRFSSFRSKRDKGWSRTIIATALLIAGSVTWLGGSILRSLVSREREYLADATGVQFTRNPEGLIKALKKISSQDKTDMPAIGQPYAHLYFNNRSLWSNLFATHPSIEKRIAALEGRKYLPKDEVV